MAEVNTTDKGSTDADKPGADRSAHYGKLSRLCAYGLYAMSLIWGAIQVTSPENGNLNFVSVLLFALLATGWAVSDGKRRGVQILPVVQMLYFFFWPIGAVIYLLYRSGVRGLLIALLHGIGLMMTSAVAFYVTLFTLHWTGMLDERYYQ